jgi:hypothetical protein
MRADTIYTDGRIIPVRMPVCDHQIINVQDAPNLSHIDFIVTEPGYMMAQEQVSHIQTFIPGRNGTDMKIIISDPSSWSNGFEIQFEMDDGLVDPLTPIEPVDPVKPVDPVVEPFILAGPVDPFDDEDEEIPGPFLDDEMVSKRVTMPASSILMF